MDDTDLFGDILRDRRERLGLSIDQVSAALKIRKSLLEEFESSNFDAFPPVGYAEGIVTSYARYLDLDPIDILDEYHASYDRYRRVRTGLSGASHADTRRADAASRSSSGRSLSKRSKPGGGQGKKSHSSRSGSRRHDDIQAGYGDPPITSGRPAVPTGREAHQLPWKLMLVIAVAIIVIGLGIWWIAVGQGSKKEAPLPKTQVETTTTPSTDTTGSNDATSSTDTSATQGATTGTETNSEPFTIKISVKAGSNSWVQASADGKQVVAENIVGPDSAEFTVADNCEITIGKPSVVTVTRDGKPVEITKDNGVGKIKLTQSNQATSGSNNTDQTDATP